MAGRPPSGARDCEKVSPLFEVCRNGELEAVKKLVTAQNVNSRDVSGRRSTPLHFAAGKQTACVESVNTAMRNEFVG